MRRKSRSALSWSISVLVHVLLLVMAVPGGGRSAGGETRLMEVGLVEMAVPAGERPPSEAGTADAAVERKSPGPPRSRPPAGPKAPAAVQSRSTPEAVPQPAPGPEPPREKDSGFGTGADFVLNRPVHYPKNAQNEGVEGRVRLAVFLATTGRARAEIIESSGDAGLDTYTLRAAAEIWRYGTPPVPLRIAVAVTYASGKVNVVFEESRPWEGEEGEP